MKKQKDRQEGRRKEEIPKELARKVEIYLWLRENGLALDEIKFLIDTPFES